MAARILVVDDDPATVELLQEFLLAKGYEVLTARDGAEALKTVKDERPHLLLDLQLPGVDGFALARQLTTKPASQHIPVLATSTYVRPEERALAAGCRGVLPKPLDTRAVLATVAKFLGR